MKNPFKELLHQEELPQILREKVVDDINFIKLSIDVADLFLIKHPKTIQSFIQDDKELKE